jgi:hypothetical protein
MPLTDRAHAGRRLALRLRHLQGTDAVVLALAGHDARRPAGGGARCRALFEEPGTLGVAAALTQEWFVHHLAALATI